MRVEEYLLAGSFRSGRSPSVLAFSRRTVAADTEAIYAVWREERTSY